MRIKNENNNLWACSLSFFSLSFIQGERRLMIIKTETHPHEITSQFRCFDCRCPSEEEEEEEKKTQREETRLMEFRWWRAVCVRVCASICVFGFIWYGMRWIYYMAFLGRLFAISVQWNESKIEFYTLTCTHTHRHKVRQSAQRSKQLYIYTNLYTDRFRLDPWWAQIYYNRVFKIQ